MFTTLQECETIEFKSSFQKEVIISIVAFTNRYGGTVYVGVDDNKNIIGVDIESETVQNYINQIKSATEPSLVVDIEVKEIEKKKIVLIKVSEFPVKPVAYKGKYYKRISNSNHQMNLAEITDMHMHMQTLQSSWDAYESNSIKYEDLDITKVDKFITKVNDTKRFTLSSDPKEALQKLNLIKDEESTNAAMLLFCKDQNIYNIHIGRFKTASMIVDDKMIRETLYEAVELCMKYIISWIKVAFEFTGAIQRTEIMEYPLKGVRELIVNAIIHRDYTSPIDTQIKIFDNKITFFNPGNLYGNMTVEKLKTDSYQAQTRNKLIAEAFYLTNDIEKYGSGYSRVRKEIVQYPTMKFEYEDMGNGYLVTLSYEKQKTDSEGISEGINSLYIFLKNNPSKRVSQLKKELGVPAKTLERWIKKLKEEDKIIFVGSKKTGGYIVK